MRYGNNSLKFSTFIELSNISNTIKDDFGKLPRPMIINLIHNA